MRPLLAAAAVLLLASGVTLAAAGVRPAPAGVPGRRRGSGLRPPAGRGLGARLAQRRDRARLAAAAAAGVAGWAVTGWLVLVAVLPAAVLGLPRLLRRPGTRAVDRLEALEEWTRHLAGVLTAGVGLEQALMVTLRSTPAAVQPEVRALVARLRAGWDTAAALRAFAEDLGDATGDLVAATLLLSAVRRGAGLAAVLEGLAGSVADDVRTRRSVEADRARPRTTARAVTLVTVVALVLLGLNRDYVRPYGTPLGQLALAVLLAAYTGALLWMHRMTRTPAVPRFLGAAAARRPWDDPLAEPGSPAATVGSAAVPAGAARAAGGGPR